MLNVPGSINIRFQGANTDEFSVGILTDRTMTPEQVWDLVERLRDSLFITEDPNYYGPNAPVLFVRQVVDADVPNPGA